MLNCPGAPFPTPQDPGASLIPLAAVPGAGRAEIVRLFCDPSTMRRLADLGIVVGAVLSLQRSAPLGGPVIVDVQGSHVALGRRLASQMAVRVLP